MTVWRLVTREILFRRLNFLLVVLAVIVAVAALVAAVTLLAAHDIRTESVIAEEIVRANAVIAARQAEADASARALKEVFRKLMLKFGYNLVVLPKDEELSSYQVKGVTDATMPESNVKTLSDSGIVTVRHLLPILQKKQIVLAGSKRREVFLIGTRGEVPIAHRDTKKPLLDDVGDKQIIVGHQVAKELGLKKKDSVKIVDREFQVILIYEERGTRDDASVWIDLKTAQQLLGQEGRINAILALSCVCTKAELDKIKIEIAGILPGTHVHTMTTDATIRYEARYAAAQEAHNKVALARTQGEEDIAGRQAERARLKAGREAFAAWLVPMMLIVSAAFTAIMTAVNARERRAEIGVWRALGVGGNKIFTIFLAKALLGGLIGAILGYPLGFLVASVGPNAPGLMQLFDPIVLGVMLVLAPFMAVAAAWVPAMLAARQDPAVVLREE